MNRPAVLPREAQLLAKAVGDATGVAVESRALAHVTSVPSQVSLRAEERRAMAHAREQEMRAQVVEMESKVKQAEAEVPKAMAESFRSGHLGIMDYYRMQNVVADTDMRQTIAGMDEDESGNPEG